jgi:uncharacterized protein (DUF1800 family)
MLAAAQSPVILGQGNNSGMSVSSSGTGGGKTFDGEGFLPNEIAASRFLAQATLGADLETILAVSQMSFPEWLDSQFVKPKLLDVLQYTQDLTAEAIDSTFAMGEDPNNIQPQMWYWHSAWWQYIMTSPDVLRARVGLALSEIFVVSEVPELGEVPLALADYYDMLLDNSFGNFRDLLEDVTYHPAMGVYLTHLNNPKSNPALNRFPDENYAREVMQLFTIGLYQLNQDGTRQLDSLNNPIPTYQNTDIQEFAKIFTGLTWGDAFGFGQNAQSELSFIQPMKMINAWHEPGEKHLLNGLVVPNRSPVNGNADIQDALDNLFNHPNVGPFIGRQLIQRLVTSNPSHDYIGRVAAAFNDNGQGTRGDMKAVIRAVLLDPEARDCALAYDPYRGMLREPITRWTHLSRAFNAFSQRGVYRNDMDDFYLNTFQRPLGSPSVFNFFSPDYVPIGPIDSAGLVAPEFQITNSVTIVGYANRMHRWVMEDNQVMEYRDIFSGEYNNDKYVNLNLDDELQLDETADVDELLERLNLILFHGQMTWDTRDRIKEALLLVPQDDWEIRIRMAIFLSMISPDYLIFR